MLTNSLGHLQVTVVDGTTLTGLFAADGSINVYDATNETGFVGLQHPCGAINCVSSSGTTLTGAQAPNGAYYVVNDSAEIGLRHSSGGLCVTNFTGYAPESLSLFARMSVEPDDTNKSYIDTFIKTLKNEGIWSKLKVLQVYAVHDTQAASLNWVVDTANATFVNSPVFTAFRWFQGNGTNSYINTNAIPSALSVGQNDASWGFFCSSPEGTSTKSNGGWGPGFVHAWAINPSISTSENPSYQIALNKTIGSYFTAAGQLSALGLITVTRDAANTERLNIRGTPGAFSTSQNSTGLSSSSIFLGGMNNNGSLSSPNTLRHSLFFISSALSASELLAFSNAVDAYMLSVGNWSRPFVTWGDSQSIPGTWIKGVWRSAQNAGRVVRLATSKGVSAETSAQIRARLEADSSFAGQVEIIWAGRNDINNSAETINSMTILSEIATMVSTVQGRGSDYLVLSPCRANLDAGTLFSKSEATGTAIGDALNTLKATLSSTYGNRYLDIEQKYIDWATDPSASTISGGVSPTANDIADAAAGITPRGLLTDDIHKNATGNLVTGYYVEQHMHANSM